MGLPVPYQLQRNTIYAWDALTGLATMRACGMRVNCVVTSPPYFGLRDYQADGQIGLEQTPDEYVRSLVRVFRAVRDVLTDDGLLFVNIGDSYTNLNRTDYASQTQSNKNRRANGDPYGSLSKGNRRAFKGNALGLKDKDLIGVPFMLAFALRTDGWYLRSDIVWNKPNAMPESVTDRPTKAHEYIFMLSKSPRYYYDSEAIAEPAFNAGETVILGGKSFSKGQAAGAGIKPSGNGNASSYTVKATRNKRSVWTVATEPSPIPHFAMYPQKLIEPCILAGCPKGGIVLDPFMGGGTTALVAQRLGRDYVGFEINPDYAEMARYRVDGRIDEYLARQRGDAYTAYMFTEQPA